MHTVQNIIATSKYMRTGCLAENKGVKKGYKNAEGRNRTDMGLLPLDFESSAYTNFATSARNTNDKILPLSRQASI